MKKNLSVTNVNNDYSLGTDLKFLYMCDIFVSFSSSVIQIQNEAVEYYSHALFIWQYITQTL